MTECCIVGYKYSIVGYVSIYSNKDFLSPKMTYLIFNWHNSVTKGNFLMRFWQNDSLWKLRQYITITLNQLKLCHLIFDVKNPLIKKMSG